jgi:hypothetical protein
MGTRPSAGMCPSPGLNPGSIYALRWFKLTSAAQPALCMGPVNAYPKAIFLPSARMASTAALSVVSV